MLIEVLRTRHDRYRKQQSVGKSDPMSPFFHVLSRLFIRWFRSFKQLLQRDLLENQVRLTAFIKNPDVLPAYRREAGVPSAPAFIQQHLVLPGPGVPVIRTEFYRYIFTEFLGIGIGENKHGFPFLV